MTTGAQPVWAGHEFRLDPNQLPQKLSYAPRDGNQEVSITVDARGAMVKRQLQKSGLPVAMALPNNVFRGVAARAVDTGPESHIVTLELLHDDDELCVPLCVGHELADIARDWKIWSELLGLPMMIITADGVAQTLEENAEAAAIKMGPAKPRRHHSFFAERRPRFLARRRMGTLGVRLMVDGDEIISHS